VNHQYPTLLDIPESLDLPTVIFLDAVGTLFGVRGSVGDIYSQVAKKYGVNVEAEVLNKCFYRAFKNSAPCTFPGVAIADIPDQEYLWWREINLQTFTAAGAYSQFADFDLFFQDLYQYFATPATWYIYPDVIPTLEKWQKSGVQLGILSNFDSRLYTVLKVLNLSAYFSTVTISTEVGAAKPQELTFTTALAKYHCPPQSAWHIGDSWEDDVVGATNVGITAIWLNRDAIDT
jgi:putative hydrolase of the HAD superfamily